MIINSVILHRRNDNANEYRQLILYCDMPVQGHWAVVEAVGFLADPDTFSRTQMQHGWEPDSRQFFAERVQQLCGEGFTKCEAQSCS